MKTMLDKYGKKALELVMEGESLFITGKAGTGKTSVLREITSQCKSSGKNVVVLAPTGVAAKNAGGVTIHSFLHLPLGPYIPGMWMRNLYVLNEEEKEIINRVDIIIIDEVSMVRCDLLDEIDDVLRHYRNKELPFGGIQMLFFGDLYQLMPVAPKEDWEHLKDFYNSPYFFSSKILEKINLPMFELKIVHRQDERTFVNLLNHIRLGQVSYAELQELEHRYKKNFVPADDEGYIRLTTHNWRSKKYNANRLEELPGRVYEYKAYIEDYFPKEERPADYVLRLKRGARVMFIKNYQQYVNGTLGTVVSLSQGGIIVKADNGEEIGVERQTWDFYRYHINKRTREIEAELCGTFKQYPLKLAWAVTIHKSQGLAFDKVIIDAGKAFTYGQVYVALSRCRQLDGVVLASRISKKIINTDPIVEQYLKNVNTITIDEDHEEDRDHKIAIHYPIARGARGTLKLLQAGLSPEQIANKRHLVPSTIYTHIVELIEAGKIDIYDFVSHDVYKYICNVIRTVGIQAPLKDIKALCIEYVQYKDIKMVIADIKHKGLEGEYELEEEDDDELEWNFVDYISFSKSSKRFLSYECRVALSNFGYYLQVGSEFIKLGDYPDGFNETNGSIWIKKPLDEKGYRIVHKCDDESFLIGYIKEEEAEIKFTTPQGRTYTINFE